MKNIIQFINEGIKLPNDKLSIIENFLNDENRSGFNKTIICNVFDQFDNVSTDIIADMAGYLVEAYIWDQMHKLITNKEFADMWIGDDNTKTYKLSPLSRHNTKGADGNNVYWDFSIDGVDEKFEIKARSTKDNKSQGGYRFTTNQKNDKNLIYILVEYSIDNDEIKIGKIKVTRKL